MWQYQITQELTEQKMQLVLRMEQAQEDNNLLPLQIELSKVKFDLPI